MRKGKMCDFVVFWSNNAIYTSQLQLQKTVEEKWVDLLAKGARGQNPGLRKY